MPDHLTCRLRLQTASSAFYSDSRLHLLFCSVPRHQKASPKATTMSKRIPDRQPVQNPRRETGQMADISIVTGDYNDSKARPIFKECAGEVTRKKKIYAAVPPPPPTAPENGRAHLPNSKGGHHYSVDNGDKAAANPNTNYAYPQSQSSQRHHNNNQSNDGAAQQQQPSDLSNVSFGANENLEVLTTVSESPRLLPSKRRGPSTSARPNVGPTENNESQSERLERSDLSLTQPNTFATAQGESKTQTARKAPPELSGCIADVAMPSKSREKCQDRRRQRTELENREELVISVYVLLSITSRRSLTPYRVTLAASLTLGVVCWVVYSTSPV